MLTVSDKYLSYSLNNPAVFKNDSQHATICYSISAIHENNGVVWSDGKGIYLAPISVHEGQVENQQPTKLGEFE